MTATICVAALTAVSTSTFAAPAADGGYDYRVGPPSNLLDVFRPVIRTAKPDGVIGTKDLPLPDDAGPANRLRAAPSNPVGRGPDGPPAKPALHRRVPAGFASLLVTGGAQPAP